MQLSGGQHVHRTRPRKHIRNAVPHAHRSQTYGCCTVLRLLGGGDARLIYRHYATLYFIFAVDSTESELGILDLIQVRTANGKETHAVQPVNPDWSPPEARELLLPPQVFVEAMDKCFENVCELDLIFHSDKARPPADAMAESGAVVC